MFSLREGQDWPSCTFFREGIGASFEPTFCAGYVRANWLETECSDICKSSAHKLHTTWKCSKLAFSQPKRCSKVNSTCPLKGLSGYMQIWRKLSRILPKFFPIFLHSRRKFIAQLRNAAAGCHVSAARPRSNKRPTSETSFLWSHSATVNLTLPKFLLYSLNPSHHECVAMWWISWHCYPYLCKA